MWFVQLAFKHQKFCCFKWLWKRAKCDSNRIKIAIFFQKITKNPPAAWGLRPHAPSVTCLSCTNLLTTSLNFNRIEKFLTCGSSSSSVPNPGYEPNQTPSFWSFILCPIKSPTFQKFLMTSLHVICDLALLPIQNPGYIRLCIKPWVTCIPDTGCCILVLLAHLHERLLTTLQRRKATKYTLNCFQSKISLVWKYGMEYGRKL